MPPNPDGLPAGEWRKNKHGVAKWRPAPNLARARAHQEHTILTILLAGKQREREALEKLVRIAQRKTSRKAA